MAEYLTGILSNLETKTTAKGKTYLLITVAGERMSAFTSNTHAAINALHNQQVSVEYTVSGDERQYKNLTHIEAQQVGTSPVAPSEMPAGLRQPQQPAPTASSPPPNAQTQAPPTVHHVTGLDVSIIRQSSLKAAVEGVKGSDAQGDVARVVQAAQFYEAWVLDGFTIPERLDRERVDPDMPF